MTPAKAELLREELEQLQLAADHLQYSIERCRDLQGQEAWSPEQLERLESFTTPSHRLRRWHAPQVRELTACQDLCLAPGRLVIPTASPVGCVGPHAAAPNRVPAASPRLPAARRGFRSGARAGNVKTITLGKGVLGDHWQPRGEAHTADRPRSRAKEAACPWLPAGAERPPRSLRRSEHGRTTRAATPVAALRDRR